jgi:hypothetical protein
LGGKELDNNEKNDQNYKVEILALDENDKEADVLYYTNDFTLEGAFIKFKPNKCLVSNMLIDMAEMTIILPSNRIKQIVIREKLEP